MAAACLGLGLANPHLTLTLTLALTLPPTSIFKMKLEELEATMEPIFAIYKVLPLTPNP